MFKLKSKLLSKNQN